MSTNKKLTKKQRFHQMNIDKQRQIKRLSKQQQQGHQNHSAVVTGGQLFTNNVSSRDASEVSSEMVEEASLRCSIDRLRNLLPPKVKVAPPSFPPRQKGAAGAVRLLPYLPSNNKKCHLPWLSVDEVESVKREGVCGDLTEELLKFAEYVTVSDKCF